MTSCTTSRRSTRISGFPMPPKPILYRIEFIPQTNGYFISEMDAKALINNIHELKAYDEKLEALLKIMGDYYAH